MSAESSPASAFLSRSRVKNRAALAAGDVAWSICDDKLALVSAVSRLAVARVTGDRTLGVAPVNLGPFHPKLRAAATTSPSGAVSTSRTRPSDRISRRSSSSYQGP